MAFTRAPRFKRKPRRRPARVNRRVARARMFNPRPVFTETYIHSTITQNTGGVMAFSISSIPQIAQYSNLYQKYRILKAKVMLLPAYVAHDENQAIVNAGAGAAWTGLGRFSYAVNDSPALAAPASEATVLEDNGCKVLPFKPKLTLQCRPVPDTLDANGVRMTLGRKFINFSTAGPDATHYGITWWYTQYGGGPISVNPVQVIVKLTFQLADPR